MKDGMSTYWGNVVPELLLRVRSECQFDEGCIKLNTTDVPYPPSARTLAALKSACDAYPRRSLDPSNRLLRSTIAERTGLTPHQVFVSHGADVVLAYAFMALRNKPPRVLIFPDVSETLYSTFCDLYGIPHRSVPLDAQFAMLMDDFIHASDAAAIVFSNPNALTGRAVQRADIARLLVARPDLVVVVDEGCIHFGGETAVPLIDSHPNLLVVQSFSKSHSLAGLRLGFGLGQAALIAGLTRIRECVDPSPVDPLTTAGAIAALADSAYFDSTVRRVISTRQRLAKDLEALQFSVLPSAANFLCVRHPRYSGQLLESALRERQILVRRFAQPHRIAEYLRLTVGTDAQSAVLVHALEELTR